jgi:hypothetical protein
MVTGRCAGLELTLGCYRNRSQHLDDGWKISDEIEVVQDVDPAVSRGLLVGENDFSAPMQPHAQVITLEGVMTTIDAEAFEYLRQISGFDVPSEQHSNYCRLARDVILQLSPNCFTLCSRQLHEQSTNLDRLHTDDFEHDFNFRSRSSDNVIPNFEVNVDIIASYILTQAQISGTLVWL